MNPAQNTLPFMNSGNHRLPVPPCVVNSMMGSIAGKTRRSYSDHCLRKMMERQATAKATAQRNVNHQNRGTAQTPQGMDAPWGSPS